MAINTGALGFAVTVDDFALAVNTTGAAVAQTFTVAGQTIALELPAGPFVRVELNGARVAVLGQTLSGNFAFEQVATAGLNGLINTNNPADKVNDDNGKAVRLAATRVQASLGGGLVHLSEGRGLFVLRQFDEGGILKQGLAGVLAGTVRGSIPGVSLGGDYELQINQSGVVVDEVLRVGGSDLALSVPAGPFLRMAARAPVWRCWARRSAATSASRRVAPRRRLLLMRSH